MTLILLILGVMILLIIGLPVAFSLGIPSIIYFLLNDLEWAVVSQRITKGTDSFTMLAIPLFILAGAIMNNSGVTDRLFTFANLLVGHIKGGLAHVNVVASMIFAGMSGSIVADVGGLGQIEIKAMKNRGFSAPFTAAITAASSLIGPIIPPSILFIVYGGLTGASIGALFIAGALPGIIMALFLMVTIYLLAIKYKFPVEQRSSFVNLVKSFFLALPSMLTPLIIVGGILLGIVTPTEASVIACLYALLLGVVYREISLNDLPKIAHEVVITTSIVMFILAVSNLFSWILIKEKIGPIMLEFFTSFTDSSLVIFILIIMIGIILGLFLDATTSLIIMIPILMPILQSYDINLIHFGIVFIIALGFGSITPPVGLAMYMSSNLAKVSIVEFVRASLPFFVALLLCIVLLILIPQISLWLPNLFIN
ncbi:TRAP transporter large permease [Virgibacillus sp. C22-A2]|uniref:TRAP transporter large permease n=1 Tax=Virgibacillus tibetensis TaxID=3042313 RepID=A0ABU6KES9_9BACI|nr:TRAP transporter large permease [Virgibacillus sp. C22-A2]